MGAKKNKNTLNNNKLLKQVWLLHTCETRVKSVSLTALSVVRVPGYLMALTVVGLPGPSPLSFSPLSPLNPLSSANPNKPHSLLHL